MEKKENSLYIKCRDSSLHPQEKKKSDGGMGQRSVAVLCQSIVKLEGKRKTRLCFYLKCYLVHCDFFCIDFDFKNYNVTYIDY